MSHDSQCQGLACGLVSSYGSNMGMLGRKRQSKARLTSGLGRDNKRTLWDRCETAHNNGVHGQCTQHFGSVWMCRRANTGRIGRTSMPSG